MPSSPLTPARAPTLYFIGVTTGRSAINRIFPAWARRLGLADARLVGLDFPLRADPAAYREAVRFIKEDPLSRGALVTTHKLDVFRAGRDLFDELDRFARLLEEVSCLSKRDGRLVGHAKDVETGRLALEAIVPPGYWRSSGAEALFLGAGGATVAVTTALLTGDPPRRITVTDVDPERIAGIRRVHEQLGAKGVDLRYEHVEDAAGNDALVESLPPRSLVANGTGLGKDRPGSPLTNAVVFPEHAIAWDYNYRGSFLFHRQAQNGGGDVRTVDGWTYFVHGWTRIIAEVFQVDIPTSGPFFDELSEIAASLR